MNSFDIPPIKRPRRFCCPFCGGRSSRCRTCGLRFSFGSALTCASDVHGRSRGPLHCRCGALVSQFGLESGDKRTELCDVPTPMGLIERLRAHATRGNSRQLIQPRDARFDALAPALTRKGDCLERSVRLNGALEE